MEIHGADSGISDPLVERLAVTGQEKIPSMSTAGNKRTRPSVNVLRTRQHDTMAITGTIAIIRNPRRHLITGGSGGRRQLTAWWPEPERGRHLLRVIMTRIEPEQMQCDFAPHRTGFDVDHQSRRMDHSANNRRADQTVKRRQ